jgi:hypothetical protein
MRNIAKESGWYDVPTKPYMLTVPWNPDVFPKQDLRDDPKYYPVQELEAHFDQGPLALLTGEKTKAIFDRLMQPVPKIVQDQIDKARKQPAKYIPVEVNPNKVVEGAPTGPVKIEIPGAEVGEDEVSEGRRWIMVNALLPWRDQIDAYTEKFRNAAGFDQKSDLPVYLGYEVERADVTGGTEPVWKPHGEKMSNRSLEYYMIRWATAKRTEIVAKVNREPIFTWPLPPRVLELWGARDKHSKLPLEATAKEKDALVRSPMAEPDPILGMEDNLENRAAERTAKTDAVSPIDFKMLRYFDFDVEPGRAYQYRFRLALRDPNYVRVGSDSNRAIQRVELKLLDERVVNRLNAKRSELEKQGLSPEIAEAYMPLIYTEWSDASPAVKVPPDLYILALKAELPPEGRYNVEPWVNLMVTKYDKILGIEVGGETKLQRGSLANFTADGVRAINVDHSTLETRQVPFNTNNMVVDLRGGETLEGSGITVPTEILLFDFDRGGKLVVADEVDDAESVHEYRQRKLQIDRLIPKEDGKKPGGGMIGPRDTDIIR